MTAPTCPLCDVEHLGALAAFAIGVAIARWLPGAHVPTTLMCTTHRIRYVAAQLAVVSVLEHHQTKQLSPQEDNDHAPGADKAKPADELSAARRPADASANIENREANAGPPLGNTTARDGGERPA